MKVEGYFINIETANETVKRLKYSRFEKLLLILTIIIPTIEIFIPIFRAQNHHPAYQA